MITMAPWVMNPHTTANKQDALTFRKPSKEDGLEVHELIASCPPLDTNSSYCNFLQAEHFRDTCVVVEKNENIVAFTSAYQPPNRRDTLFIWQVAVSPKARGCGVGFRMLEALLDRPENAGIRYIETTITDDNRGSWALFHKFNQHHGRHGDVTTFLDKHAHFDGHHDSEYLFRIELKSS
ncbi:MULTISPECIES: diaminobutyrate acetyltransferase [Photobacterium]|nr:MULTISPECIES: diaminobutyrate acetyltransferase [Photobacterium]